MTTLTRPVQKWVAFAIYCLMFLVPNPTQAQTITLGSGTDINGITENSPINIHRRKTVCQMVYTASELIAAGASSGEITQLGFFVTNNPIYDLPDYEIQIKHTTDTDASGNLEGGYTTVKTIASYAPAGGWDMLILDTPFLWDGIQNLVVRVCWSRVNPTRDPSGQLRIYTATDGYKFRRNNSEGSMCGSVPSAVRDYKPQIRFVFQDETEWTGTVSSDWFDSANWTANVPDETMNVLIPSGVPNDPFLTGTTSCKTFTNNGNFTLGETGILNIYEDFGNAGTYSDLGGIVSFTGIGAHEISTSDSVTIMNLHNNSAEGTSIVAGTVVIGEELQVNKGEFSTNDALIVRSVASGTARIAELKTTCTYTLNMSDTWGDGWNGGFLTVYEDGVEIGTFWALEDASTSTFKIEDGASFTLEYTSGSFEGENSYSLLNEDGDVLFSDGPAPFSGSVYSDVASGCSFLSIITGNITMERYIDAGETYWRYFASAVEDPEIAQYLDDFTTAGFPGTPFPDFPFTSIYSYDETLGPGAGYVPCAGTDQIIEVGQGYQVWSGDTITGTEPFLVDLVGPANQGDIDMPVTYTPSAAPTEDGWCLVGNPYASTIDWDSPDWTKTNMADATYIQDPDTQHYATYVNGAGANGGTQYIASQQSFWVQATGTAPVLTAREGVKSDVDATFFRVGETLSPGMSIILDNGTRTDEAIIRHVDGASDEFEINYDARKLYGGWGVNPQLTVLNEEGENLTVHSFDKGFSEWSIPLNTIVFETGIHVLKFTNAMELDVPCLKLEDSYTGILYDINVIEETVLEFEMYDTTSLPRFILHLGRQYEQVTLKANCHGSADGEFELALDLDEEVSYSLSKEDWSDTGTSYGDPLVIDGLEHGYYTLALNDFEEFCGTDTFKFSIAQPLEISIESTIEDETYGEDGSIVIDVDGGTPPYTYSWSNDETSSAIYELSPGDYDVLIKDVNDCALTDTFTVGSVLGVDSEIIEEEELKFTYSIENKQITISGQVGTDELALYSISGDLIAWYNISENVGQTVVNLPVDLARGVYFIRSAEESWHYRFSY